MFFLRGTRNSLIFEYTNKAKQNAMNLANLTIVNNLPLLTIKQVADTIADCQHNLDRGPQAEHAETREVMVACFEELQSRC